MSIVKLSNNGVKNATAFGSITGLGSMTFIKKLTASSSATLSFVDGSNGVVLDNSYKEYLFTFNNIHPETDNVAIQFNMSTDGGSNYNVTKTSTFILAQHQESGSGQELEYTTAEHLAQSTSFQSLIRTALGNDADQSASGYLTLFNPSSTTFVKHFIGNLNNVAAVDRSFHNLSAGYGNTTSAVDAIQFKMNTGNIDAGDICLYGIA